MTKQFILLLSLMTVAGVSYAQVNDTVRVSQDTTATISDTNFYLSPSVKALEEVKITAERPLYAVDGEKQVYNTEDDPSVQTGTASDALQNAPGVEVDAEGNITLRGSQGVDVWINDRPSNLSGESLRQYIKTLPANSIARIEVITNPSARYGGGGPVVNIVTTKKVLRNEFLSLGLSGNHRPQVSPWASYVYGGKKFSINVYAEYDYSHTWGDRQGHSAMLTPQGDTSAVTDYSSHSDYHRHSGFLYIGGHYDIDTQRTFSFWAGAYPSAYSINGTTDLQWQERIYAPGDYSYHQSLTGRIPQGGYYGGLDYSHRLDTLGQRLWLRLYSNGFGYRSPSTTERRYAVQHQLDYTILDNAELNSWGKTMVQAGYTLPFAQHWELEVGASGSYNFPDSYVCTRDSLPSGHRDTLRSYTRSQENWGYNAYATLTRRVGNLTAQLGMQLGVTHSGVTYRGYIDTTTRCNWLEPVPSLHLSYHTATFHNFTLSYTYRTSSPSATQLSPFVFFHDNSFSTGCPDLRPSGNHNIEGGWSKYFENLGTAEVNLYYKALTNGLGTLTDVAYHPVFGREVPYTHDLNIGSTQMAGADLNLTYRPTALFNVRLTASLMHDSYRLQFRPGEWAEDRLWSGSVRLNVWGKLWDVLQVFGNVRYTTRKLSLMGLTDPCFTTDLGLSADLLERRLSLYLNVKDVFASNITSATSTNPYLVTASTESTSSRYISFGLTLRLGKMELESQARMGKND